MIAPDGTSYDLSGPEHAPVLALIHGLGLCRNVWDALLPSLGHYRVLNYDLYGHGSSAPASQTTSLRVYANQLAHLMEHLEISDACVIGFSIGGMINRRFALDHLAKLSSLVILNSPHDRGDEAQKQVEDRALQARAQGTMATMDAALQRWFTPEYLSGEGSGADLVRAWRQQADPESYAQAAWVLANGVRELIAPSPPISVPTLVMTSADDVGSTPVMSHAIGAEISGSEVIVVPGLRHLGLMERPELFAAPITAFLQSQRP